MYPNTFKFHASLQVSSSTSDKFPGGIAPALLIKISIFPQNSVTFSTAFF